MKFYYDPTNEKCKNTVGAVARRSELIINVFSEGGTECFFDLNADGQPSVRLAMTKTNFGWTISVPTDTVGLYFYRFILDGTYYGRGRNRLAECNSEKAWQITVYKEDFETPEWFKGGIMYQIFPDRFFKKGDIPIGEGKILRSDWGGMPVYQPDERGIVRNNDFFGGNIEGIIQKLDYLASLGVSVIYLNPIFEAASNHRYDTGDYMKIDSLLGTKSDFERLVQKAGEKGIRILLDGVFNHTGDDSLYFNKKGHYPSIGAHQSKYSEYYAWYNIYDFPDGYECWWGIDTLPSVNEKSTGYRNFIMGENGVIKTWLQTGVSGFRLDVADELPDFFLKELRQSVKEANPQALIIGEVWEDASNKIAYDERREYFHGDELDSVMNYPLKDAIIRFITQNCSEELVETVKTLQDNYPKTVLDSLMNILSTHDTARILTVLGEKPAFCKDEMAKIGLSEQERKIALQKLQRAAVLQYTLPGVPCIYYGDENGAEGYSDPFCRRCFDWERLNQPCIDFYALLGKIRRENCDVFSEGKFIDVYHDGSFMLFARATQNKRIYVYVNNGYKSFSIRLNGSYTELLTNTAVSDLLTVEALQFGILLKSNF